MVYSGILTRPSRLLESQLRSTAVLSRNTSYSPLILPVDWAIDVTEPLVEAVGPQQSAHGVPSAVIHRRSLRQQPTNCRCSSGLGFTDRVAPGVVDAENLDFAV